MSELLDKLRDLLPGVSDVRLNNVIDVVRAALEVEPAPPRKDPPGFAAFWDAYPKKQGKDAARRAWARKRPPIDLCMTAIGWQLNSKQWRDGYVPNPATWINDGRWEDPKPVVHTLPRTAGPRAMYEPEPFTPSEPWPRGRH